MEHAVPPYLFAFVVGELGNTEVGPRTRVYAEDVLAVLDLVAKEFFGMEEMIRERERLFGSYSVCGA
ncbi:Leukotriene A-4 hydrolase-like [Spatholobus suberectus]|nr:Leukotriene A-4 hydrolase-like [Spatholobus suberectus]